MPLYEEITELSPRYVAGGAAQNAARGAQASVQILDLLYLPANFTILVCATSKISRLYRVCWEGFLRRPACQCLQCQGRGED